LWGFTKPHFQKDEVLIMVSNTAVQLFILGIILFVLYIGIVFCIQIYKNVNTLTAAKIFWQFIKEAFHSETKVKIFYPVCIGIDAFGCCDSDKINEAFESLHKVFTSIVFQGYKAYSDWMEYYFHIGSKKREMSTLETMDLCEELCEGIFRAFSARSNVYLGGIRHLVAVSIIDNTLIVYVARSEDGVKMINERRRSLHDVETAQKDVVGNKPLTEDWQE
jgi:hypothetical protein